MNLLNEFRLAAKSQFGSKWSDEDITRAFARACGCLDLFEGLDSDGTGIIVDSLGRHEYYIRGTHVAGPHVYNEHVADTQRKAAPVRPSTTNRFAKKRARVGAMSPAKRIGTGKDAKIVLMDGSPAPKWIKPSMIPPAWADVRIATDPKADVLARGTMNGKAVTVYSESYEAKNEKVKFARLKELLKKKSRIDAEIQRDRKKEETQEEADVAWLMDEYAIRPGSERDNKGREILYGKPVSAKNFLLGDERDKQGNRKSVRLLIEHDLPIQAVKSGDQFESGGRLLTVRKLSLKHDKVAVTVNDERGETVELKLPLEKPVKLKSIAIRDKKAKLEIERRVEDKLPFEDSTYWLKSHGATTLEARHVNPGPFGGVSLAFSVTGDTPVFVEFGGQKQLMPIAEAVSRFDLGESGKVLSLGEDGRTALHDISDVISHDEEVIEIYYRGSKTPVRMTKGHSVFIIRQGSLVCVPAGELENGDFLAALSSWQDRQQQIQMVSCPDKQYFGRPGASTYRTTIPLDEDLAWLLGIYCAEGHITEHAVGWTLHEDEIEYQERICDLTERVLGKRAAGARHVDTNASKAVQVVLSCTALSPFFVEQCGKLAEGKHIPSLLWDSPESVIRAFLDGYFGGDAHVREKYYVVAKTVSKRLHLEINWLLHFMGIPTSVWYEKEGIQTFNLIRGSYNSNKQRTYVTGFPKRCLGLETVRDNYASAPIHTVPSDGLRSVAGLLARKKRITQKHKLYGRRYGNAATIAKGLIKQTTDWMCDAWGLPDEVKEMCARYDVLSHMEVGCRKITKIVRNGVIEKVYDFSVPGTERFFGGVLPLLLHNSGKESVMHNITIPKGPMAQMLMERKQIAEDEHGPSGKLFKTDSHKVLDYVKQLDGGGFLAKDMRTARANQIAMAEIAKVDQLPTNKKEYKQAVKAVAEKVSSFLGNTPSMAVNSYISPTLWETWQHSLETSLQESLALTEANGTVESPTQPGKDWRLDRTGPQGGKYWKYAPKAPPEPLTPSSSETKSKSSLLDRESDFSMLKSIWANLNNKLLDYVNSPESPEAKKLMDRLKNVVKSMHIARPGSWVSEGPGRDLAVIGAGPGGLAAAVMGGTDGLNTVYIEGQAKSGGQAKFSSRIENFPGFPIGITGNDLTNRMREQAERVGADAMYGAYVSGLKYDPETGMKTLELSNGEKIEARSVVIAAGLEFRKLHFDGSDSDKIIYGDGERVTKEGADHPVVIVGGSNGAAQAALGAAKTASRVYVLARSDIKNTMSDYQIEALKNHTKIEVIEGESIKKFDGESNIIETDKGRQIPAQCIGVFIGSTPNLKWLPKEIELKNGKIKADGNLETTIPGVFVAGDVRDGSIGRVGAAVGEGQLAERGIFQYFEREKARMAAKKKPVTESVEQVPDGKIKKRYDPKEWDHIIDMAFFADEQNPYFSQTVERPIINKEGQG